MQLYALDREKKIIFARNALKQTDYYCLECEGPVRRRGGLHRKDHFYHQDTLRECRQNGKTLAHLNVQLFFLNVLPEGECILERRFPEINRIADVVWESKKLIFEVQCSSISSNEVHERNQDYKQIGYEVVWILHDKRFNQKRLTGAEHFLFSWPHYFTNMTEDGKGEIYDQFSLIDRGARFNRLKLLSIDVSKPKYIEHDADVSLRIIQNKIKRSRLYFSMDLVDRYFSQGREDAYISEAEKSEKGIDDKKPEKVHEWIITQFFHFFVKPYRLMLQFFLERACK